MPVYSMTGYASAQHGAAQAATPTPEARARRRAVLGLEIRSVNSRFLDLTFRLPEELRQHEPALREAAHEPAQARQGRGARRAREPARRRQPARAVAALLQRLNAVQDNVTGLAARAPRALSVADVLRLAASDAGADTATGPRR